MQGLLTRLQLILSINFFLFTSYRENKQYKHVPKGGWQIRGRGMRILKVLENPGILTDVLIHNGKTYPLRQVKSSSECMELKNPLWLQDFSV